MAECGAGRGGGAMAVSGRCDLLFSDMAVDMKFNLMSMSMT